MDRSWNISSWTQTFALKVHFEGRKAEWPLVVWCDTSTAACCRSIEQDWVSELICPQPSVLFLLQWKSLKGQTDVFVSRMCGIFLHSFVQLLPFSVCNLQCCGDSCVNTSNAPHFPVCFGFFFCFLSFRPFMFVLESQGSMCQANVVYFLIPAMWEKLHSRLFWMLHRLMTGPQQDSCDVMLRLWHHQNKKQNKYTI